MSTKFLIKANYDACFLNVQVVIFPTVQLEKPNVRA